MLAQDEVKQLEQVLGPKDQFLCQKPNKQVR